MHVIGHTAANEDNFVRYADPLPASPVLAIRLRPGGVSRRGNAAERACDGIVTLQDMSDSEKLFEEKTLDISDLFKYSRHHSGAEPSMQGVTEDGAGMIRTGILRCELPFVATMKIDARRPHRSCRWRASLL